ncbi:MAG TPA: UDP-N-acetylmuramoyl-tripeptide--D-alanyl-D-alanine ligase [Flavobacteriales bacterium]|nr:UDP-N-acetylmuramoyl-tripeptide--D-alanyl-D-alanine ligase [Flavobacteriales bacterium]
MTIPELHTLFLKHQQVCTDTRKIIDGSIFFALKGENFNGNKFAQQALEQGCAYAVIDEKEYAVGNKTILVNNVLTCLQQLASFHRDYWNTAGGYVRRDVIALTGSNGKTTTKELIHAVLRQTMHCYATVGNLNNHIGVPLTLLALKPEHTLAIVEMGANHQKEIELLCNIAKPNFGIITNVGKAHLEGFGGEEGVLKGKGELYDYIRQHDGHIFVNGDDEKLMKIAKGISAYTYGYGEHNMVKGKILDKNIFLEMEVSADGEVKHVATNLTGTYNGINVLCAYAVGWIFDMEHEQIIKGIESYTPDNSRSQVVKTGFNTLILDAYNANPSSMSLALENLARIDAPQKMFVLGDMREMGEHAQAEHLAILNKIKELKLNGILVGEEFSRYRNNFDFTFFENTPKALEWLKEMKIKNNLVLIKGSRGIKLEQVVEAF